MGKKESIDVRGIFAGTCFVLYSVISVTGLLCGPRGYYESSLILSRGVYICFCLIVGILILLGKKRPVGILFGVLALYVASYKISLYLLLAEIVTFILLAFFHLTPKKQPLISKIWWIPIVVYSYTLLYLGGGQAPVRPTAYPWWPYVGKALGYVFFLSVVLDCIWIRGNKPFIKRKVEEAIAMDGAVYSVKGVRGRYLYVFDNKVIIHTKRNLGSLFTGNATDGEKTIYYVDCIGVQFKRSDATIGYLQLETASGMMNNKDSNFFNENTFTFDGNNIKMHEIATYVKARIEEVKTHKNQPAIQEISKADEIKKFKELLDEGIINQEEFDAKKKELLGL